MDIAFNNKPADAFLWLDFEFTGLGIKDDVVIEIGAIATTGLFDIQGEFTTFVHYPIGHVEQLLKRNEWWTARPEHALAMLQNSNNADVGIEEAAASLAAFGDKHAEGRKLYLAGNSIHNDRRWIDRDFPALAERLEYRMLDVSSLKLLVVNTHGVEVVKQENHRAIDDLHESMAELRLLLEQLKQQ